MLVNTLIKRRGCEAVVVCTCDASDPNRAPMMMMMGGGLTRLPSRSAGTLEPG